LQEAAFGRTRILKHLPGVLDTQAGRANCNEITKTDYDGYADVSKQPVSIEDLIHRFNEIIDPIASTNKETI
jgi:peptide methionine sulfoxide reductase MsrA